jgi:cytochrome c oxidase subunit 4
MDHPFPIDLSFLVIPGPSALFADSARARCGRLRNDDPKIPRERSTMNREILKQTARTPALALLGLLALLAINIGLAYMPIGQHLRLPVKLTICFGMAFALMVSCMHLHRAAGLLRLAAATGFAWLAIMIGLMLTDYFTRVPVPPPW